VPVQLQKGDDLSTKNGSGNVSLGQALLSIKRRRKLPPKEEKHDQVTP
jgi:hypothetical protein